MNKATQLKLLLQMTTLFSHLAWANPMEKLPHYTAASLSLDEIMTKANDKDSLISKLQASIDKICAPQDRTNEEEERKREIVDTKFLTRFKKELSRYKIKLSLGDIDSLIDTKYFAGGAGYQYVVEPAFRNNEQLRKDIWTFKVGVRIPTDLAIGASTTVRFTFSRFYGGKNAKWDAMKACPYFLTQVPMNTNEVKSKLRDGDGFRFEIIGNTSAGRGTAKDSSNMQSSVYAGVKTEALFLMDLYKISNQIVRTRLMGVKNKGEFSIGFAATTDAPASFIRGKLRDALTLGFGGQLRKARSIFALKDQYPLDSMMVDYLFRFSSSEQLNLENVKARTDIAEAGLEELMTSIRKVGFASLFFTAPGENAKVDQEQGHKLLEKVKISEDLSRVDLERYRRGEIEAKQIRVRSFFKGRMQSDLFAGEGNLWLSELISKRAQTRKYLGRESYNYAHDLDILVNADKSQNPGSISDIVVRTEIRDTDLSVSEINEIKGSLARSLPENFKNNPEFDKFFPAVVQTNAFLSHRYVFGSEAFSSVSRMDRNNLGQKIYEFLEAHPSRKNMHLKVDNNEHQGGLGTYALEKAHEIANVVDPKGTDRDRLNAFVIAKRDPIFDKYLLGEFFASILPSEASQSLFGLNLKIGSSEVGSPADLNLGGKNVSPVYEAVAFLKAVISDPSLDLQMISDGSTSQPHGLIVPNKGAIQLPNRIVKP